ncbi:MAG: lysophospholipid acyltransferase family protein [Paracoccaceae bacterium]
MSARKKIADSAWLNRRVEALVAGWVRFAHATSRWERIGFEPMDDVLASGEPVIAVLWHQRLMMAPYLFDPSKGPICTLTSTGRAGRLAGQMVARFGLGTIAMKSHDRNLALTRAVMGQMKAGTSVGLAADGPRGPARLASAAPVSWARASGRRVFVLSYSARRVWVLGTWDRMWVPLPFTRGVLMCREWGEQVPRSADAQMTESYRQKLEAALNAVTEEADRQVGRIG